MSLSLLLNLSPTLSLTLRLALSLAWILALASALVLDLRLAMAAVFGPGRRVHRGDPRLACGAFSAAFHYSINSDRI